MTRHNRDDVVAALRAEDVANHLGIKGAWRGRWMRSRRCGQTDHPSEAFGLSRDGRWHCHACDQGGDLLSLLALASNLSLSEDFPAVLELAAEVAGLAEPVPDFFTGEVPKKPSRAPEEPLPSLPERERIARARARWIWERLWTTRDLALPQQYLRQRGLDPDRILSREELRSTPVKLSAELRADIERGAAKDEAKVIWRTMGTLPGTQSMVIPVRAVSDGGLVDLRSRRVEPRPDQPKIVGMVGGLTVDPGERGQPRRLIGCYGNPHSIESDHVVVVEGAMDYLTAIHLWPNAQVLGAVDAGSFSLVAGHAARALAESDGTSRLTIVQQNDPPRTLRDGRVVAGAADAATNEDPNSATKVALRHLGSAKRVGWLLCAVEGHPSVKDLNDLVAGGEDVNAMISRSWAAMMSRT